MAMSSLDSEEGRHGWAQMTYSRVSFEALFRNLPLAYASSLSLITYWKKTDVRWWIQYIIAYEFKL